MNKILCIIILSGILILTLIGSKINVRENITTDMDNNDLKNKTQQINNEINTIENNLKSLESKVSDLEQKRGDNSLRQKNLENKLSNLQKRYNKRGLIKAEVEAIESSQNSILKNSERVDKFKDTILNQRRKDKKEGFIPFFKYKIVEGNDGTSPPGKTTKTDSFTETGRSADDTCKLDIIKKSADEIADAGQRATDAKTVDAAFEAKEKGQYAHDAALSAFNKCQEEQCKKAIRKDIKQKDNNIEDVFKSFDILLNTMDIVNGHCDDTQCPPQNVNGGTTKSARDSGVSSRDSEEQSIRQIGASSLSETNKKTTSGRSKDRTSNYDSLTDWYNNTCLNDDIGHQVEGPFTMWDNPYDSNVDDPNFEVYYDDF